MNKRKEKDVVRRSNSTEFWVQYDSDNQWNDFRITSSYHEAKAVLRYHAKKKPAMKFRSIQRLTMVETREWVIK